MNPEKLPAEVLGDVVRVVGAKVTLLGRLPGGVNAGAMRVQVAGRADAVLKAVPQAHPDLLHETLRAQRVVEHMRGRGYPTPAWLGVGATATHVWHLMDFVDALPAPELTSSLVEQLMQINELQSGLPPPPRAPDMVHADLNPSNVLTRDGVVVALVDIGNAGTGTRAADLVTLQWHTFQHPLDGVRGRLWTKILDLVGWEWAAALVATQILLQLGWRIGLARGDAVTEVIDRGHLAFDELDARR